MKNKYIAYPLVAICLLCVVVGGLYLAFDKGYLLINNPSLAHYPVQGIDVSHHQGIVRWQTIDTTTVQFASIKATEGADFNDKSFSINYQQARQQGIAVGAYHFFTFCSSGDKQADNFIHTVPYDSTNLAPAIDLELDGNCKKDNYREDILGEIANYIHCVEAHYKKKVVIYATHAFYNTYLVGHFPDNPIWIRDVFAKPRLKNNRQWTIWQYTNRGRITGVDGYIDLNVFNGNRQQFKQLMQLP